MRWNLTPADMATLVKIVRDLPNFGNDEDRKSALQHALGLTERAKTAVSLNLHGNPEPVATRIITHLASFGMLEDGNDVLELFLVKSVIPKIDTPDGEAIKVLIDRYRTIQAPPPESERAPKASPEFDPRPEDVKTAIRARLDALKESRALNENKEPVGVLRLVSGELACGEPGDGKTLSDHIATWLTTRREVRDLMSLARACGQLHQQGKQQEARQIGAVVNQALPLFLAQEILADAWDQLDNEGAVLIRTSLTKGTGAEILVAGLHHRPAEFTKGIREPVGAHHVPYESDPIGDPNWNVDSALRNLYVLAFHTEVKENDRKAFALEIKHSPEAIREELKAYYQALKDRNRVPCYCVVKLAATDTDRKNQARALKDLGIPDLLFIGLSSETGTRGFERYVITCLNTLFEYEEKGKPA